MTKLCREPVEVLATSPDRRAPDGAPAAFRWRGATYQVRAVLGFWREDAGPWWREGIEVPQRDLWRVDTGRGVVELVCERGRWRLSRLWD